jgi:hypothetical protein
LSCPFINILLLLQSTWWSQPAASENLPERPEFAAQLEGLKHGVNVVFDLNRFTSSPSPASSQLQEMPTGET